MCLRHTCWDRIPEHFTPREIQGLFSVASYHLGQIGYGQEVPLASCIAWEMTLLQAWSAWWTALAAQMARAASWPGPPAREKTKKHSEFTWLLKCYLKTTYEQHLRQPLKLCPEAQQCYLLLCVLLIWPLWIFQSSGQQVHDLLTKKTKNRVNHDNQTDTLFPFLRLPQEKKKGSFQINY